MWSYLLIISLITPQSPLVAICTARFNIQQFYVPLTQCTVGSRFATVRFTTIHFYDPCRVGPSTSVLCCITVATQSVLSLLSAFLALPVCLCFFIFYFNAVLFSWLWFFHPWRPSKRQKIRKTQNSWRYILSWCLLNHGLDLLQQNKTWFEWYFCSIICVIFYIPNSLNSNCMS